MAPSAERKPIDAPARMGVSVVVVNYNGLQFLPACLDSLPMALAGCAYEVIVVDNASSDGSVAYLRRRADVRLIESPVNVGFAAGNNIGAAQARGGLLLLLNNDTQCLTSLLPLLACLDDERIGVAGCALRYADDRLQPSVGYDHTPLRVVLSWLGLGALGLRGRILSRVEADPAYYRRSQSRIDWLSGACLLTRADLWRLIGGLDERFFMYCEDVDYCWRARQAGYEIAYTPASAVCHYEAAGQSWVGGKALRRTARSYLLYMRKRFGGLAQLFVGTALGLVFLVRSLAYRLAAAVAAEQTILRDKCGAYREAGIYLVTHGLASDELEVVR